MKIKPIKTHVGDYDILLRSLSIEDYFIKNIDWDDPRRDYCIYVWRHIATNTIYYIGKGIFIKNRWHLCRVVMHRNDLLSNTINPQEWIGEVWFEGLSEKQAYAAEAYLISIAERSRSHRGQRVWKIDSLINKRREWKNEKLIEKYLKLDGNNNWETLGREINGY